jgi:hypothetical protein
MARAVAKKQFVVSLESIKAGRETSAGRVMPVVMRGGEKKAAPAKNAKSGNGTLRARKISE